MAVLHLMVGLPCSGKTTYARELSKKINALVLSPDAWYKKLFGEELTQESYEKNYGNIESIMWDVAQRVLEMGCDVIFDYGFWSREQRDNIRNTAKKLGVDLRLHYMDVPHFELYQRIEERNKNLPEGVFVINKTAMDEYIAGFEPPAAEELL